MTKRYPLCSALGRGNPRDSRNLQRIALWILEAAPRGQHLWLHVDEALRHGCTRGDLLGGDVHHFYFAAFSVMREFRHRFSLPHRGSRYYEKTSHNILAKQNGDRFAGIDPLSVGRNDQKTIGMGQ